MKKWIETFHVIVIFCVFLFINFSAYSQERYEKVNIYMLYGYPSIFHEGCSHNEDHTRVNHKVFFSTFESNFKYELKEIIDNIEKKPYENYENDFLCYVVIDFIQNSYTRFSIALDEYGNFRFEERGKIYKKQDALIKFLNDHFGYFLNPYHRLYERKDEK